MNDGDLYEARSYLYVPGDNSRHLEGALSHGADALVLDLEDAVSATAKADARAMAGQWLREHDPAGTQIWVRVNSESMAADIENVACARLTGIVVPKAEPATVRQADQILAAQERRAGLAEHSIAVLALIESARGLLAAAELAAAPRVARLGIGEVDLAADLRLDLTEDGQEMTPLRLQVVVASAAARIAAPVAPVSRDFRDLEALRRSTRAVRRLGFRSRTAIHPAQVAVINEAFAPTEREVDAARRLIESFSVSQRAGIAVATDENGHMIDVAVLRAARETLCRAGAISR